MNKLLFSFVCSLFLGLFFLPIFFESSYSQENQIIPPRHQWKQLPDPDNLTCKEGLVLLQKITGIPACVEPSTYLKLVDRGYGHFNSSHLMKNPEMMTLLMEGMIEDTQLMHHWHNMMINDTKILQQTMSNTVLKLKENPTFLANIMGPMTLNSELRVQMIEQMKNHNEMMNSFHAHPRWMDSVHQPMMGSALGQGMGFEMHGKSECSWCPETEHRDLHSHQGFHQPKIMEDMLHHVWVNEKMRTHMHNHMLENPHHMKMMTDQMMESTLGYMMDDPELRQQMIEMMLENQEFMNSIRHENNFSD